VTKPLVIDLLQREHRRSQPGLWRSLKLTLGFLGGGPPPGAIGVSLIRTLVIHIGATRHAAVVRPARVPIQYKKSIV